MQLDSQMLSNKSLSSEDKVFIVFFNKTSVSKHVAYCIILDVESMVVDEVRTSKFH